MKRKDPGKIAQMEAMFERKDAPEDSSVLGKDDYLSKSVKSSTQPSLPACSFARTAHAENSGNSSSSKLSEPPVLPEKHLKVSSKSSKKCALIHVRSDDTPRTEQATQAVPQRSQGSSHPKNPRKPPNKPLPIPQKPPDTEICTVDAHSSRVTNGSCSDSDLYESVELDPKQETGHWGESTCVATREPGQIDIDASVMSGGNNNTSLQLPGKSVPISPVLPSSSQARPLPQLPPPVPPHRRLPRQQTSADDPLDCHLTRPSPAPLAIRRESRAKSILVERELQFALKNPPPVKSLGRAPPIPPRDYPKQSSLLHALKRTDPLLLCGEIPLVLRRKVPPVPPLPAVKCPLIRARIPDSSEPLMSLNNQAPSRIPYICATSDDRDSDGSGEYMETVSSPKPDFDSYYSLGHLEEKLYEPPPAVRDEDEGYDRPLQLLASSTGELEAPVNTIPLESLLLPQIKVSLAETELRYLSLYDSLTELMYQEEGCRGSLAFSRFVGRMELLSEDENSRQEAVSTHRLVMGVLNDLERSMMNVDSRFSGTVIGTGSFHDGTKIGEADEFDFIYELEDSDFELHLHEEQSLGFLLIPGEGKWGDKYDPYFDLCALSASGMAKAFANSVGQAMALVPLPQGLKHAGFCSPAYSGLRRNGPAVTIILLKGEKDRLISIDLTLALPVKLEEVLRHVPHLYESWPSLVIETLEQHPVLHLIPTSGRHWRLTTAQLDVQLLQSFHDNGLVKRSIRQLKLLRERYLAIHVATKDFSMALAWMRQLVQEVVKDTTVKEHTKNLLYSGMVREATLFYMLCEEHLWLTDCEFCLKDLKAIQNDLAKSLYSSWGFLDPALQIYAYEIDLPLITIKSCVFKYIILDMFFKGEIRDDPDERDVALGVPDMQVICKALYLAGKDEVRHALLGTNIQTKSLSPFAERGVPGIGSSDWKLLYNRLHARFIGIVTSFFSETPNLGNMTPTPGCNLGRNLRCTLLPPAQTDSQLRKLQEELKAQNELLAFYQKENETLKEQNSLLEMQVISLSEQVEDHSDKGY